MIEVKDLKKVYKMKKGLRVNALDGVSLRFPDKGMVFILGKSGSGKSTLLNVIGGLDTFDSGEIIIKGKSSKDFKQTHFDSYRNTYIGFIFQEYNILDELTVGANIALAIELQGRTATNEEINAILKEVDLEGYGGRKPNELSGGQKQRVAIARALVKKPEIIMADEPTGALDSATGKQVFDTLKALSRDKLVVIVSHDREFSEQYADRIIELADGVVISDVEKSSDADTVEVYEPEEDEAINFSDGEIRISKGYMLTEEDRILINKYLAEGEGAVIKTKEVKKKRRVSSGEFVPTDESKIARHTGNDFKLIKSRLSIRNAFKLGSSGLKYKKFRLVFTIFLSLISFTLFGLADTIGAYNRVKTATTSLIDTGVSYASFMKEIKRYYGDSKNDYYWMDYNTYLSKADIARIEEETGVDVVGVYNKRISLRFSSNSANDSDINYDTIYGQNFAGLAGIDKDLVNSIGFTLHGSYPKKDANEIVITDFVYDYFVKTGYLDKDKAETVEIKSYDDLIGKTFNVGLTNNEKDEWKIVGILDTGLDYSRYEDLADPNVTNTMNPIIYSSLMGELEALRSASYATVLFVDSSIIDKLVENVENSAESLDGASINLVLVKNKNENTYADGNMLNSFYISAANTLEKAGDSVVWFGDEYTSLAENQIIISFSMLLETMSANDYNLYDPEILVGYEKTLYEASQNGEAGIYVWSLQSILESYKQIAAYRWASENKSEAKNIYKKWESSNMWGGYHDADYYESKEFLVEFAYRFAEGVLTFNGSDEIVAAYLQELDGRYGVSKYFMPEEAIKMLIAETGSGSKYFASYEASDIKFKFRFRDNYREIIARKYATENDDDAKNFYKLVYPSHQGIDKIDTRSIVEAYANYLLGYHNPNSDKLTSFKPTASVGFEDYMYGLIGEVYGVIQSSQNSGNGGMVIEWWNNFGGNNTIRDAEIVGFLKPEEMKDGFGYYSSNIAVISDELLKTVLGANLGGIYSYAIGNMPEGYGNVTEIVEFSYSEFDDETIRYTLKNNVTEQLSYVDELLVMLGQIFLYVGLGFALFASLMLSNFIGTSIAHKKHDIGILRAIGSRSSDVFKIFFAESFIIAMINFILSLAGTFTVTMVINKILREDAGILITFLNFGVRQIAVLLGVSMLVALIATFLPVKKIASMKPIDAIRSLR